MANKPLTDKKVTDAPILVSDYMTKKLVTFTEEQSILEVMEVFASNHISGGPVVDSRGAISGIISEAE